MTAERGTGDGGEKAELPADATLRQLLELTFPDSDEARLWMGRPLPVFDGRTPGDLIREGELDRVIGALAGIRGGTFL